MTNATIETWSREVLLKHQLDQTFINLSTFFVVYSTIYFLFNGFNPTKLALQKWRFNGSKYPDRTIVDFEVLRSFRSVLICSALDALIIKLKHEKGWFPLFIGNEASASPSALMPEIRADPMLFFAKTIALLLWSDLHFYFTHRLLHTQYLFFSVHSVHHESKNPDAFSGLSFHWIEAIIYFSSLLGCAFIPMSLPMYTTFRLALIVAPVGHNSAGPRPHEQYYPQPWEDHYLHHIVVTKNFASGLLPYGGIWDNLLGTRYVPAAFRDKSE